MLDILMYLMGGSSQLLAFGSGSPYLRVFDGANAVTVPDAPTTTVMSAAFNNDGSILAVGLSASPYLAFYKNNDGVLESLAAPSSLPDGQQFGVAFSQDGSLFASAGSGTTKVKLWSVSGTTLTPLTAPSTQPPNTVLGCAFSPDGTYLAVAHLDSPYVTIYKNNGSNVFTKLANPAALPSDNGQAVAFSPDGNFLAVGSRPGPSFLRIYQRTGDVFASVATPTIAEYVQDLSWSPDGAYLAVAHHGGDCFTVLKQDGTTFTALTAPADKPTIRSNDVSWASNSQIAVSSPFSPPLLIYTLSEDTLTLKTDGPEVLTGSGDCVAYSP